jgi:hypothetical protein
VGRAVASCDYDGDGDEDLLVVNNGGPAVLLRNDAAPRGEWMALDLRTRGGREAYGAVARVAVRAGGKRAVRRHECRAARSYAASCDPRVRAGLGGGSPVVEGVEIRVEIRWPSGARQSVGPLASGQVHRISEP